MTRKRKIALFLPILQILMLLSVWFYSLVIKKFTQVFFMMNIEESQLSPLASFVFLPPGRYAYPAAVLGLTGVVIGLWVTKRLNGRLARAIRNLYLCVAIAGILMVAGSIFAPMSASMSDSDVAYMPLPSETTTAYHEAASKPVPPVETARYEEYGDNPLRQVAREPLSTFGLDVSTGSYANVRRFLNSGRFPPADAVRVEELLNYFPTLAEETRLEPLADTPFRVAYQLAPSPWDDEKTLLWVGVKAAEQDYREAPRANLVFLVDVSGSMGSPERLPLVQSSLKLLVDRLRPEDTVSLVTYANGSRVVLDPTPGSARATILSAIEQLTAGGGTAGSAGIQLAYEQAQKAFVPGGVNRVLLCTDGDFNIGIADDAELKSLLTRKREQNVTLSILAYGTDNLNDAMMVKLAGVGNGNYSYIDTLSEARKVLDEEMESTLIVVAKDVKAQIEFNPAVVLEYRQIGYEKRQLKAEAFNDDKVDAGDVGAGKRVTVLYELTLVGQKGSVDPLRYASAPTSPDAAPQSGELGYLKLRWKQPDGKDSALGELPLSPKTLVPSFAGANGSLRFSAAVAAFGQKLRDNPQLADTPWKDIALWAEEAKGSDKGGYRAELVRLVGLAESLADR